MEFCVYIVPCATSFRMYFTNDLQVLISKNIMVNFLQTWLPIIFLCICSSSYQEVESISYPFEPVSVLWLALTNKMQGKWLYASSRPMALKSLTPSIFVILETPWHLRRSKYWLKEAMWKRWEIMKQERERKRLSQTLASTAISDRCQTCEWSHLGWSYTSWIPRWMWPYEWFWSTLSGPENQPVELKEIKDHCF